MVDVSAARASFTVLADAQRSLLRQLQQAQSDLTTGRFAVIVATASVSAATGRLTRARAEEAAATDTLTKLSKRVARFRAEVDELAGAVYRHVDHTAPLAAVATSDASSLSRARTYARAPEAVLEARVAQAVALRARALAVRDQLQQVRVQADRLSAQMRSQLESQQQALAAANAATSEATAAVTAALGSGALLLSLVADPHFGADFITAALGTAEAGQDDPGTLFGALQLPIATAPLGSPYGARVDPLSGDLSFHPGVDFEAGTGTPIHAAAAGTVVIAGDCGGYGNCIVIDHGHSLATVSAHQSRILVTVGQQVLADQVVGLVGSTGQSTGPHLHFEVRLHGVPIDPMIALSG